MKIRLLTNEAYDRIISQIDEVLEKRNRGYGVLPVKIKDVTFAIPFRSNMRHKHGFKTIFHNGKWNGLDYSKAIIIEDSDLQNGSFKLRSQDEYKKVIKNKDKIKAQFEKYVTDYINFVSQNIVITPSRFGHTTLKNYHDELGLTQ